MTPNPDWKALRERLYYQAQRWGGKNRATRFELDAIALIKEQERVMQMGKEAIITYSKWISIERTDEDNGQEVNDYLDKVLKQLGEAVAQIEGML
jgi:DNA-binding ferritin-like protein